MKKPLRICIVLEGSYPFITGGVSAWVHDLISNLTEIDFVLFTISPEKNMPLRYTLPENIREHIDIPLGKLEKWEKVPGKRRISLKKLKCFTNPLLQGIPPILNRSLITSQKGTIFMMTPLPATQDGNF